MALKYLSDLKQIVAGKPRRKLVLAAAQDQHSLGAVLRAWQDDLIEPVLVGDREGIQGICEENGYSISGLTIVHQPDIELAAETAVKMLSSKQADVLMKGKIGTSALLKRVLNRENTNFQAIYLYLPGQIMMVYFEAFLI